MKNYGKAVVNLHKDRDLHSPYAYAAQKDYINIVLKAVLKYEKESDQRNMINNKMIHHIESIYSNSS